MICLEITEYPIAYAVWLDLPMDMPQPELTYPHLCRTAFVEQDDGYGELVYSNANVCYNFLSDTGY